MNKSIWIINHYASNMFKEKGGRHYWLAKYLTARGYKVKIFCASQVHNSNANYIKDKKLYMETRVEGVSIVYIKTRRYTNNGKDRILNMLDFYKNVQKVAKKYSRPDVIIGSSVHPLACVAAIKLSHKLKCKNIIEIRDLWPESLIAYGIIGKQSIISAILYRGEKWIYKNANHIIMTWPGGYDYIKDRGWSKDIPKEKVSHISNGVDNKSFRRNVKKYEYHDDNLSRKNILKISYTGSIRRVNNVKMLIDAAEILNSKGNQKALILIWGEGNERKKLENEIKSKRLSNIIIKGKIDKQYIPSILSQSDALILHNASTSLDKYGQSQNKFFEYLAAGKPILMTYSVGHSVVQKKTCGIEITQQTAENIAAGIDHFCRLSGDEYSLYCRNAKTAAEEYDYPTLTNKLIEVIEKL